MMARAFGDKNIAKKYDAKSLSHQTIARGAVELSDRVSTDLHVSDKCRYFSLAYVRAWVTWINLWLSFQLLRKTTVINEELLQTMPFHVTTKGFDI